VITESLGNEVLNNSVVDSQKSTNALFTPLQGSQTGDGGMTMVVGLTPGREDAFIGNTTVTGKSSLVGEADNAVIIGSETAKTYNSTVGSTITVNNETFKVVGIMKKVGSGWPLTIDSSMVMSLAHAQNISDRDGLVSTVIMVPSNGNSQQTVEDTLQSAYPKYDVYTEKDTQKTIDNQLKEVMIFMNMVIIMIFAVSMVLIMNVMMMSVKEKTKDIGTMRALGTKKRSIMLLIIYESLILSSIGGIIGILLISPVYSLLGILMGATNFNFVLPTSVIVQVAVIVLVIGTFSGLLPAYLANKISPIEALRYE
jgi:putative ABC transport system permease protein